MRPVRCAHWSRFVERPCKRTRAIEGFIQPQVENNDLTNQEIPRAVRAKIRKAFPPQAPDISRMDFETLAAWHKECGLQRMVASAWTLEGYRWRRAASRASREYTARLLAHTGVIPGLCDQCQTRPITAHVAYKPMEAPRFAHYCDSCAPGMPPGWLSVTAFNRSPAVSLVA